MASTDAAAIAKVLDSTTSKAIMDKDRVRPAQVRSYLPLLSKVQAILPKVPANAHGQAAGLDTAQRQALGKLMSSLPKSHRWVKGLVAVYIAANR